MFFKYLICNVILKSMNNYRTAARRCRMKRKQRWELLSEENRKLKIENSKLREAITRLISRSYTNIS